MENVKKVFEGLEKIGTSKTVINEGDYIVDGLYYCGKCHTPKQLKVELFGKVEKPFCVCKCENEKLESEQRARENQERLQKIDRMRSVGFAESEMKSFTFANDDHKNNKTTKIALNFVEHFEEMKKLGKGLLMYGPVGTGKTFTAACIANALIDRGIPCLVTNFARLVNTIQGIYEGKQQYIDGLNKFDLLVLDDLSSERDTEYMNEIVQNIIDCRYRAGLPTIVTTNLSAEELQNPADITKQRTYSRLLEMCIPIKVEGLDRRKEKIKTDCNKLNELLGL